MEGILFDIGGTLRSSQPSTQATKRAKVRQIMELVNAQIPEQEFSDLLSSRAKAYACWAREQWAELNERNLWTQWMLPEWPASLIGTRAIELNQLWRQATGTRQILPETKDVVVELFHRGYRLGIVSNTVSSVEVPRALRELEISGIFETVVLSCLVGVRKPDPALLLEATRRMGIDPGRCAYVGDRHDRDVAASRAAGFSEAVIIRSSDPLGEPDPDNDAQRADHYIDNLKELLGIFPPRATRSVVQPAYDASVSTMWAMQNFPGLPDFLEAAAKLGFSHVELNHQVDSSMLEGLDSRPYPFISVHEPCPADVSTEELKERDWLISSTTAACRQHGVEAIKRTIDFASGLGVPQIVIHAGMVSPDMSLEKQLRVLFEAGKRHTAEYRGIQNALIEARAAVAGMHLEAVKKSLQELLDYADGRAIRLGLENRYHYFDIPSLDEMGELLAMAGSDRLGFVYDVGHAQTLDHLGFFVHEDWLRRYSSRMIEVHLHDVMGTHDHLAPGLGTVDFDVIASYLPDTAIRVLELQPATHSVEIRAALKYLAEHHCVQTLLQG